MPQHALANPDTIPPTKPLADATSVGGDTVDVPFAVPVRMRLRFTRDLLGKDAGVAADLLTDGPSPARVLIACDSGVSRLQPARLRAFEASLGSAGVAVSEVLEIPGGEAGKNRPEVIECVLAAVEAAGLDRQSYVLAIGGGATLDVVGYATAIAHRGLRLVRAPTTTLSQADSGVAVKNGVNRFGKKNWQGVFAPPWGVINDSAVLQTLPDRDFASGFSEAVKVALLKSPPLFDRLQADADRLRRREWEACGPAIRESALWHLEHIAHGGDPFEQTTARPLDFGHWSAHRLETLSGFRLRHGEAVAIGVALDAAYSSLVHGLDPATAEAIRTTLARLPLPIYDPLLDEAEALLAGLEEFRQHLGGRLTVTMLAGVGRPIDVHEVDPAAMREAIATLKRAAAASQGL